MISVAVLLMTGSSCDKLMDTSPTADLGSNQVFASASSSLTAINGIYRAMYVAEWGPAWETMKRIFCFLVLSLVFLTGCAYSTYKTKQDSFTIGKTYSFNNAFYALQTVEEVDGTKHVTVTVFSSENDEAVYSFTPARASDFWGICWETDTYNIWIQSGDIGVICYAYTDGKWEINPTAIRPDSIVSKYDK